jgi:hypothetical protein
MTSGIPVSGGMIWRWCLEGLHRRVLVVGCKAGLAAPIYGKNRAADHVMGDNCA